MIYKREEIALSIIVVTYNSHEYILSCLNSVLRDSEGIRKEVFVVDNFSTDNTVALIKETFPEIILIENNRNTGFAVANNFAIKEAKGKYILLLNPDTIITAGTFSELLNFMEENPDIGVLSPKLVKSDGSLDYACRRNFPTPLDVYFHLLGLDRIFPNSKLFAHYNLLYLDPSQSCDVECVAGAFMLVRGAAVSMVGLMDERFFMYVEDLDWAYRFRLSGWRVYYYAKREVIHYKKGSTSKESDGMLPEFYRALYQGYEKYYGQKTIFVLNWMMYLTLNGFLFLSLFFYRCQRVFIRIFGSLEKRY